MADEPEVQFGRWLVSLKRAVQNPTRTLKRIGVMVTSRIQKRFETQVGPDGKTWAPRMTPNIPGILMDLERGSTVKSRRFEERPAVVDFGHLMNSISHRIESVDSVLIGTTKAYASAQHFGAERVIPITQTMKNGLRELLRTFRRTAKRAARAGAPAPQHDLTRLAFLLYRDEFKFNIIPRPFVGISDEDHDDIIEIIRGNFLGDALKESTT